MARASNYMYASQTGTLTLMPKTREMETAGTLINIQRFETASSWLEADVMQELRYEWPEVVSIIKKLVSNARLSGYDEEWIKEIASSTGWNANDVVEDLREMVSTDLSERIDKYRDLFNEYAKEAERHFNSGNYKQAGEKLYAAALALVKLYAAAKGVPIIHWSRGKIERFITNSMKEEHRNLFRDLLDKVQILHEHFYEDILDEQTFRERWKATLEILNKCREITLKENFQK
ncbi:MAG: PaREP1 family protein [Infirmifilum sp.]